MPEAARPATIGEVAARAGVSPMTVSRVLNDPETVKEAKRVAVERAMEELDYRPNPAARALAGGEAARVALFYDNPSASYLSAFLMGAMNETQKRHAQLTVIRCQAGREKKALAELKALGAQGVLLPPPLCDSAKLQKAIAGAGLTAVSVAGGGQSGEVSAVRIDDFAAAKAMTEYLLALGHRRIGFIAGNPDQTASGERARGYRAALAEAGIGFEEEWMTQGLFTYRSGLEASEELLGRKPRVTAIFASNDDMAAAAVAVAHRRRLEVPGELTVCGFDDTEMARSIWPELTTVQQPVAEMAAAAAEMLLAEMRAKQRGKAVEARVRVFDFRLVERESADRASA